MGGEETQGKAFVYLTDAEFEALDTKAKALYLVRAQQAVEAQQELLREHHKRLNKELEDKLTR